MMGIASASSRVIVDAGAANALETRGGSLLAVGVLGVRGGFGADLR